MAPPLRRSPSVWRFTRRASRLFNYLFIAIAVFLVARWSRDCGTPLEAASSIRRQAPSNVDFAWGSLLHRFQNHPRPSPPRDLLPWKRSSLLKSKDKRIRTLIVTSELAGLHKNGGIGTAYSELAGALAARRNMEVSILVTHEAKAFPVKQRKGLEASLKERKIKLHFVEEEHQPVFPKAWTPVASIRVWQWLRSRDGEFDIIHFPDNTGIGYFSTLGKHEGLALQQSRIVVGLHGPDAEWAALLNKKYPQDRYSVDLGEFERRTVEMADVVVAPSEYILEYVRSRGWKTPRHSFVIPNIVKPEPLDYIHPNAELEVHPITELVFFGRLEERKGTRLFINMLELLYSDNSTYSRPTFDTITFLGRDMPDENSRSDASSLLTQALLAIQDHTNATFEFKFLKDSDRDQALAYLKDPSRLAILPALADNSPSTVLECVIHSIRFIASSVGGVPELVHQEDQERALFAPLAAPFATKVFNVVQELETKPWNPIRQRLETITAADDWVDLHSWIDSIPHPPPPSDDYEPLITICITHYERPHLITQLLDSLLAQSYKNFQIILVDDGSTSKEAIEQLDNLERDYFDAPDHSSTWHVLRIENSYLGEARNRAAELAEGEWLLFLDDDDVLKLHALETLVKVAAKTGVSALSTWLDEFATDVNPIEEATLPHRRTYWFLGQSLSAGMMSNCFGSGNIFVSHAAFEAVGGFSTYREVGAEDWEFYMRLALGGHQQLVVPEELIFVRSDPSRYSMKFSMDPWDANFHALVPILNDDRVQELGLAHALMVAKAAVTRNEAPPHFADSFEDYQLLQGWSGWSYTFEPADELPTLSDPRFAVLWDGQWSYDRNSAGGFMNEQLQKPYVSPRGDRFAAVRSWRAPKAMDVAVEVSYRAEHQCGDGTELVLMSRRSIGEDWEEHVRWKTMDDAFAEYRVDLTLKEGSQVVLWSDPLETDECDALEVRVSLFPIIVDNLAWSNLAKKADIAATVAREVKQAKEDDGEAEWKAAIIEQETIDPDTIYHIALIFDRARLPHALQVIRSATQFITSRTLHIHTIAPVELHDELYEFMAAYNHTLRPYDHNLCKLAGKQVLPFSNPDIHLSAHCKMFLADIITGDVDTILYLDTDTTILSDISVCYDKPELSSTLISMGVDMGDACQVSPNLCWPIGMHWRVPPGLVCGNEPSKDKPLATQDCAQEGELEAVQVNGGVALFQLKRMREVGFIDRYVQSVVHHYRLVGGVAEWGEQDFINSYFRLFPTDLEFLPCGCNYQWFGSRREVKCGAQPIVIAHHWSHGIAARTDNPFNVLFHHFLDQNETNAKAPLPPIPSLTPSLPGSFNSSRIKIENTLNCPRQTHDCSLPFKTEGQYGKPVKILSRALSETFVSDLVDTLDFQNYPSIEHFIAVRPQANIPSSTVSRDEVDLEVDIEGDYATLCEHCGALTDDGEACSVPPRGLEARREYWDCVCRLQDPSAAIMYDLDALAGDGNPGWVLYLNDDKTFVDVNSLAHLMAQVDDERELILFRSNTTNEEADFDYRKKIVPRSEMEGVGFLFHTSNLDATDWDGLRCGISSTFDSLSKRLRMKWIDLVPTMTHPLQRHLPQTLADDFKMTVVILENQGRISWTPPLVEMLQTQELTPLVKDLLVLSVDTEGGAYGRNVKVVNLKAGSGLSEIAALVKTEAVLLLSDSIFLDKPALTALLTHWLDDPLRLVGFFTETEAEDFSPPLSHDQEGFDHADEADPLVGIPRYSHLLPRTLLTHKVHLDTLTKTVASAAPRKSKPLHPTCHPLLLSALASKTSGGLSPLRVLPPPATLVDRVDDCRSRNWADVDQAEQQVGDYELGSKEPKPSLEECIVAVDVLMGGSGKGAEDGLERDWLVWGEEVGTSGPLGVKSETMEGPVEAARWLQARRREGCMKA
ncbi:hypothetical protein BCR35DRAFT_289498 [Leucosporidium creatinivorum]|uniref:Proteophosphoglycan ppg4 n=1 Tax=Leucosporidium creatinivorum TaxID=106004 RepID=A0A1Y2FW78_9BASI|nr:hypothetical protein BCR35DRAFT_289498 [Leucosporidium creatinivorum]